MLSCAHGRAEGQSRGRFSALRRVRSCAYPSGMERKLATVLFVDLVGSTQLVASADPEVVRSRLTRFFDQVAHCITAHGGIVEKFAGDAVMAAFGVPLAHEDDPERAVRAALGDRRRASTSSASRCGSGSSRARSSSDETETTFATGLAINAAARLQQAAEPGEILLGPAVERLTRGTVVDDAARRAGGARLPRRGRGVARGLGLRGGRPRGSSSRRRSSGARRSSSCSTTRSRAPSATGASHLVTVYGGPGVGKSRLAREFVDGVERSTILSGRCLPYGEGVTYWAVAEMVKVAAGITDDDSIDAAAEKLRELLRRRGGGRSARARLRRARRGRRASGLRRRSPGPRRPGRPSSPTCSRSCSCSRTSTGPRSRCST